ncbi:MAG: Asp23/Gls24 family envelope stress response protein [Lachnospiraceae bacterium]|nr:Asp23/Gls24 family envelope stress response protein [Lachnospiraceae bacterium]
MDKTTDKITLNLEGKEDMGVVQIADDVVATIAALAAVEVEGVNSLAGNISGSLISKKQRSVSKCARVDVVGENVKVDIALVMDYGYSIPATCKKAQDKIKLAVENMTGLNCTDVNIRIAGVNMA